MTYTITVCTVKNSWWWTGELSETCRFPSWSCSLAGWHIPLLCVQWKNPDDGQRNCSKHVQFYSKNKFEKLVHLVGFIVRRNFIGHLYIMDKINAQKIDALILLASCQQNVYVLLCVQWKTPDDGKRNCPKHVQFYSKNKFDKLSASSWFYYKENVCTYRNAIQDAMQYCNIDMQSGTPTSNELAQALVQCKQLQVQLGVYNPRLHMPSYYCKLQKLNPRQFREISLQ
jgi:hypothetical protein